MTTDRKILDLLSSEEIDELIEPDSLHAVKAARNDDIDSQMALVTETFPHIGRMIRTTWGSQEFYSYMDTILFSNRPNRVGFPPPIVSALTNLLRVHGKTCPRVTGSVQPKPRA